MQPRAHAAIWCTPDVALMGSDALWSGMLWGGMFWNDLFWNGVLWNGFSGVY